MLKAEFAWLDDLFVGARVRCKREQQGDENDSQENEKGYH